MKTKGDDLERIIDSIDLLSFRVDERLTEIETTLERTNKLLPANDMILMAGQVQGGHHKAWYIDQLARLMLGDDYDALTKNLDWDK